MTNPTDVLFHKLTRLIDGAEITVGLIGRDPEWSHKTTCAYSIKVKGHDAHTGTDLTVLTRETTHATLNEAFRALCSSLSAAAESYAAEMRSGHPGENGDLFPGYIGEWAYGASDELSFASMDDDDDELDRPECPGGPHPFGPCGGE